MTAPLHRLPPEVVDLIVDYVVELCSHPCSSKRHRTSNMSPSPRTVKALTRLSSTSRLFRRQCLVHLFRRLDVQVDDAYDDDAVKKMERTLELFKGAPELATFVREVKVEMDFGNVTSDHPILQGPIDPGEWRASSRRMARRKQVQAVIAKLIPMLGRLESVELSHVPMPFHFLWMSADDWRGSVEWSAVRREVRKVLMRMMVVRSGENLKSLRLSGFADVPLRMLAKLRVLRDLELPNSTTTLAVGEDDAVGLQLPWRLGFLNAASGLDVLGSDSVVLSGVYQQITHLRLVIGTMETNALAWNIIKCARETIVSVKLDYSPHRSEPNFIYECFLETRNPQRNLPYCSRLRELSVSLLAQQESARLGFSPTISHTIPGLLSNLIEGSYLPALESFSAIADIRISLDQLQAWPNVRFVPDRNLGWDRLDDTLADEGRLPLLRKVDVRINPELVVEDGVSGAIMPAWDCDEEVEEAVNESVRREVEDALWKWSRRFGDTKDRLS